MDAADDSEIRRLWVSGDQSGIVAAFGESALGTLLLILEEEIAADRSEKAKLACETLCLTGGREAALERLDLNFSYRSTAARALILDLIDTLTLDMFDILAQPQPAPDPKAAEMPVSPSNLGPKLQLAGRGRVEGVVSRFALAEQQRARSAEEQSRIDNARILEQAHLREVQIRDKRMREEQIRSERYRAERIAKERNSKERVARSMRAKITTGSEARMVLASILGTLGDTPPGAVLLECFSGYEWKDFSSAIDVVGYIEGECARWHEFCPVSLVSLVKAVGVLCPDNEFGLLFDRLDAQTEMRYETRSGGWLKTFKFRAVRVGTEFRAAVRIENEGQWFD